MATKLDKCASRINDQFAEKLGAAFKKKFRRNLETSFNIISMRLISEPANGKPFTPEQKAWLVAYSDGYGEALSIARAMANGSPA